GSLATGTAWTSSATTRALVTCTDASAMIIFKVARRSSTVSTRNIVLGSNSADSGSGVKFASRARESMLLLLRPLPLQPPFGTSRQFLIVLGNPKQLTL